MKLTLDEKARRWAVWVVANLLGLFHGDEAWRTWLWELTPFPAGIPRWSECASGLLAALLPWPLHGPFMNSQIRTSYEQMDRSFERYKRENPTWNQ